MAPGETTEGVKNRLKELLFGNENRIGRRLIVLTIAFSSIITLCLSVVQLAMEYRDLRSSLDRQLDGIAIHVPAISGSIWDFDEKQIQRAVDALILLPDIVAARVVAADASKQWLAGKAPSPNVVIRSFVLSFESRGRTLEIGKLEVVATLDGIYRQVINSALGIVLSNGLKTLLVAIFMVVLIRRLITGRLEAMASRVRALAPGMLPIRQVVEGHAQPMPEALDELDTVAWTLDKTGEDLRAAVTALNRLNEDLERNVDERTRELESFSYSISHDLRTPLRAINGFSTILLNDYNDKLDDEGRRLLNVVRKNTERMGQLIEDMLQFARMGRQGLTATAIDVESLFRSVFAELQTSVAGRSVQLEIGPLPRALGDASLIRQVVVNLLTNAIKFTQPRIVTRINVSGSVEGKQSVYCVKDNGVGFDMQYVGKLFEVFERLHGNDEFEGTGIGLAIVKRVVTRHGGSVWAVGKVDEGAAVHFTLPQA